MKTYRLRITGDLGFEFWQDIPEYEGQYQASTYGRIRITKNEYVMHLFNNGYGYLQVQLKGKTYKVHRLIGRTFIPNYHNKPQIDHIDTNRENNRVENLRWVTNKENSNNPITLAKIKRGRDPEYSKKYYQLHKEQIKKRTKEYREENKEYFIEYSKKYRIDNKDKLAEYNKKYRIDNKDKLAEYSKKYRIDNKDKLAEYRKHLNN